MIDLAESRRLMDNATSGIGRYKICCNDPPIKVLVTTGSQLTLWIACGATEVWGRWLVAKPD